MCNKLSVTDAKEVDKEEPRQIQCVSGVYIGIFFEGSDFNMTNEVVKGTSNNITSPFYNDANELLRLQKEKSAYIRKLSEHPTKSIYDGSLSNIISINELLREYSAAPDINADLLCEVEGLGSMENGFTNVSLLYSLCSGAGIPNSQNVFQKFYIEGCGIGDLSQGSRFQIPSAATGTGPGGIADKVSNAINYATKFISSLSDIKPGSTTLHFYVFGFSRGAACARSFCHLLTGGEAGDWIKLYPMTADSLNKLNQYTRSQKYTVDFLGLFDTVSSFNLSSNDDVDKYCLYTNKDKIQRICHLCAMDEFRKFYPLIDIGETVPGNAIEVFIPGCHADVGGGYVDGKEESSLLRDTRLKLKTGDYFKMPDKNNCLVIGPDTFMLIGWANNQSEVSTEHSGYLLPQINGYVLKKKASRGYADIPLAMMKDYCNTSTGSNIFSPIPAERNFQEHTDSELQTIGNWLYTRFFSKSTGKRYAIRPDDKDYKYLRSNYLHFSSDDSFFNNDQHSYLGITNAPDHDPDFVLARRVFHGEKGKGNADYFTYQLEGDENNKDNNLDKRLSLTEKRFRMDIMTKKEKSVIHKIDLMERRMNHR